VPEEIEITDNELIALGLMINNPMDEIDQALALLNTKQQTKVALKSWFEHEEPYSKDVFWGMLTALMIEEHITEKQHARLMILKQKNSPK
jgi:hypothetical protein